MHFFLQKERVNQTRMRFKIGTKSDWKSQKPGSSSQNLLPISKYETTPTPDHDLSLASKTITLVKVACTLRTPTPYLKVVCFYNTQSDSIMLYTPSH